MIRTIVDVVKILEVLAWSARTKNMLGIEMETGIGIGTEAETEIGITIGIKGGTQVGIGIAIKEGIGIGIGTGIGTTTGTGTGTEVETETADVVMMPTMHQVAAVAAVTPTTSVVVIMTTTANAPPKRTPQLMSALPPQVSPKPWSPKKTVKFLVPLKKRTESVRSWV